ncbi:MAG: alpha/beta fold hydrolase [Actinomycetota bacterium]|nr:alpha/beta fold hydrolase [Actinomycetota bacterium]
MKKRVHLSEWKTPEAEHRFHTREDDLVGERLAERPAAIDVETHLGPTRAYFWAGTGEPVVFLHGAGGTGTTWAPYADYREGRAMYAIDTIGDLGRSRQQKPVESADDLSRWLEETLTGLGVEHAHLAGTSYGAFLALNLATSRPGAVRSLYLIEPAGLVRVVIAKFMLWGMSSLFASLLPKSLRRIAAQRLRNPLVEDRELMRLGLYGARHHRSRLLRPEPLTDEQLHSIEAPTHFVLGAKSEVFPVNAARARAFLLPNATTEVISGAGHAVAMSGADTLAPELARFLSRHDTRLDTVERPEQR